MKTHAILSTDLSNASDKLIDCASEYKQLGIKKITLMHALGLKHIQAFEDIMRKGVDEKLEEQKKRLEEQGFDVDTIVKSGIAKEELEKLAKELDAALIIVGTHGISLTKAVIGRTASEIILNMKYPVLLVVMKGIETKEGEECELYCNQFINHILLPTDFSDSVEHAYQWLKAREVKLPKLTLMHIQDEVRIQKHLEHKLEEFNRIDTERLQRLKNDFQKAHPETQVDIVVDYGKPLEKILDFVNDNEVCLTVMGSQGRGFISRVFLGSTSHEVARHSDSNVLLVPKPRD
ncbi:MAG: universal stress protein [Bacteroidales bacterium]|nr:universal stress protein [Bacteroidales bacterium]